MNGSIAHFFIAAFACLLISSGAARAEHSTDPNSYYQLIMDPTPDTVEFNLGEKCVAELRKYFNSGKDLNFAEVRSKAVTVEMAPFPSKTIDRIFYHYTRAEEVKTAAMIGDLSPIFNFLRRVNHYYTNFFIAEDPISSLGRGDIQVRITLKEGSLISSFQFYNVEPYLNSASSGGFSNCILRAKQGYDDLTSLVMEESGITLYNYYAGFQWFQLIDPRGVEKFELGEKNKW